MEDYKSEYEAALARAKAVYLTDDDKKGAMEAVFPELMELDKDDEIRQALIKYFTLWGKSTPSTMGFSNEDIVDWLKRVKSVRVKSAKVTTGKLAEMIAERNFEVKVHYWTEEEIEPIISDYLRGAEHYGGMICRLRCLKPKSMKGAEWTKAYIELIDILIHIFYVNYPDNYYKVAMPELHSISSNEIISRLESLKQRLQ